MQHKHAAATYKCSSSHFISDYLERSRVNNSTHSRMSLRQLNFRTNVEPSLDILALMYLTIGCADWSMHVPISLLKDSSDRSLNSTYARSV